MERRRKTLVISREFVEPPGRWVWVDSAESSNEEDARHKNYDYDQMRLKSVEMHSERPEEEWTEPQSILAVP